MPVTLYAISPLLTYNTGRHKNIVTDAKERQDCSLPVTSQEVVDRKVMKPEIIQQELEHLKQKNMHITQLF